jgi:hypothetical protein
MRPRHAFAPPFTDDRTRLLALLHGPLRFPLRLVMVLMPLEGYPASTIAEPFGHDLHRAPLDPAL